MSDNHDLLNDNDMCSFSGHEAEDMCFNCGDHTCGERLPAMSHRYLENLDFTRLFAHFVFALNVENVLEKEYKRDLPVRAGIELVVYSLNWAYSPTAYSPRPKHPLTIPPAFTSYF